MLASEVFLVAHDEMTGRSRLHPRQLSVVLAAALLAELEYMRIAGIERGNIYIVSPDPPGDGVAHRVMEYMRSQRQYTDLDTWIKYISLDAETWVAQRLILGNLVSRVEKRRFLRAPTILYPPTDYARSAGIPVVLGRALLSGPSKLDIYLAEFLDMVGLLRPAFVEPAEYYAACERLQHETSRRGRMPQGAVELIGAAKGVVGGAVLAPH
jgi:hypothetical protein